MPAHSKQVSSTDVQTSARQRPEFFRTLTIHGWTIDRVLLDQRWAEQPRDLDVVELESGVEAVTRAARARGHRAQPYDIKRDPVLEDILQERGFLYAVTLVMRLRAGGLLGQAPVCSSFVGLNIVNTKRCKSNFAGDEDYPPVAAGNALADISFFLMGLALARA